MAIDSYAEAISLQQIEMQLARCAEQDAHHPPDMDCARAAVRQSVCPCVLCEDAVVNTLATMVHEHFVRR